jgi:biotin operon repressor
LTASACQEHLDVVPRPRDLEKHWVAALDDSNPLAALSAIRELRESLTAWESQLARKALSGGETWETIGAALGISRQAAWERLRRGIAAQIEAERTRLRARQAQLKDERSKRWRTTT